MPNDDAKKLANGRWFQLLTQIGGIDPEFLKDDHGPCPLCGGDDRWRWDDRNEDGGGYCNQCGGKNGTGGAISGFDLLMRARGWDFKTAAREVTVALGGEVADAKPTTAKRKTKPARIPEKPPFAADAPAPGKSVAQWCYTDINGDQLFWIQRYEDPTKPDKRGKPKKTMVHRTWLDGGWHFPKKTDEFTSEWPSPRPLLGQAGLPRRPEAPVLAVEGETTYDAACLLFPGHVVVTWSNGSKAVGHVDWTPLQNRDVVIWRDNDKDGEQCEAKLVGILREVGAASIRVVQPPEGAPVGWDLADAEDWDEADAAAYLEANSSEAPEGGGGDLAPPEASDSAPKPKRPFGLLGFAGDDFYYQPDESGQVTVISGSKHSAINMLRIARLEYWLDKYPKYNGQGEVINVNWQAAFNDLFAEQYRVGFFDPERIRGLGAWWDRKRVVLHLGDRLIVDEKVHYLTQPFDSTYHYQRLRRLEGPGDAVPLSDAEAMQVIEIASAFQWEDPSSAFLLAGWLAIAAICGCLKWRPHLWLTAAKGTGKSTIIDRFVGVLLGDLFIQPEGTATEPGIRQDLMSSALAVVFDEAGAAKEKDKMRIQSIIEFARSCSKEGKGKIMKGSSDQSGAKKFSPKAMFLLSSVTTALKEGQDSSRFTQLTLKKDERLSKEQQAKHWADLDMALASTITEEFALRLIARTINLIPMIREAVDVFEVATAEHLGTPRLGEQYGALAAGAWSLCSQEPPTLEQAREWLRQHPLMAQAESSEVDDEKSCLQTILEHQLRVDVDRGVKTATVLALLEIAADRRFQDDGIDKPRAVKALGAIGVTVKDGRLMVSNTAKGLRKLLKDTPFEACWPTVLGRMPDARKPQSSVWFPGVGTTRATSLPLPQFKDEDDSSVSG